MRVSGSVASGRMSEFQEHREVRIKGPVLVGVKAFNENTRKWEYEHRNTGTWKYKHKGT